MKTPVHSPFATEVKSPRFRFSFSSIFLLLLIVAVMTAGIGYSMQSQTIRRELLSLFGISTVVSDPGDSRIHHLVFLLFCYASPLLITALLGLVRALLHFTPGFLIWTQPAERTATIDDELWENRPLPTAPKSTADPFRITKKM